MADDAVVLEVAGREVTVTHPHKVFFPQRGETKLDLVSFYAEIGEPLMRWMGGRPVLMERYPDGASGKSFFQKRVPSGAPEWLETTIVETVNGTPSNALVAADLAHVVWAVNLGCLGFHVWPYHADDPAHVDELRIDLDPTPGITFPEVRDAARRTKEFLDELGIRCFAKTTGSKGIHIYVPLLAQWDAYQVRQAAVIVARELERRHPDTITGQWWKEQRGRRVFVDFNQNAPHKTVFGAWSVRARVGGQVSCPFDWDELDDVHPDTMTMAVVAGRVAERGDPWAGMADDPQSIEPLLAMWDRDRAAGVPDAPWPPVYPKMPDEAPRVAPSRARKDARDSDQA